MIMRVLKAIVFIICAIISSNCFAQNVSVRYIYDESGNRISRTLVTAKAEQDGRCVADDGFAEHQSLAHNNTDDNWIFVYPNPTDDKFTVTLSESTGKAYRITLYNMMGILIEEHDVMASSSFVFDLTGKSSGTYLIYIVSDGKSRTWKVVKR